MSVQDNYPSYADVDGARVFGAHTPGSGCTPGLGQPITTAPPGVPHTHSNGVRVSVSTQHSAASVGSAETHRQVERILKRRTDLANPRTACTPVDGVTAAFPATPPRPTSGTDAKHGNIERMSGEMVAAARAATQSGVNSAKVAHEPHPYMAAWRGWLMARMRDTERTLFPGPDQPPLNGQGEIDMAGSMYDALHATDDSHESWLWPTGVPQGMVCWHDGHCFQGPPVAIPVRRELSGVYVMDGAFCSVPCAVAYIQAQPHGEQVRNTQLMMLTSFLRTVIPHDATAVEGRLMRPAVPLRALQCRGGSMTIEQWRTASHCDVLTMTERVPPYVPDTVMMELQTRDTVMLAKLETEHTVRPKTQHIEIPSSHVPELDAFAHMKEVASRQHGACMYAAHWDAHGGGDGDGDGGPGGS
jgi:hypothetical protein